MDKTLNFVSSKMKKHQPALDGEFENYLDSLSADEIRLLAKYGLIAICSNYASAFNALKRFLEKGSN